MGFFDDDFFDEIFRDFMGESPLRRERRERFIRGEQEERKIDYVEDNGRVYLIFELPGYDEKDVFIVVKNGAVEISAKKHDTGDVQGYLKEKLSKGVSIQKKLPNIINPKNFKHTVKNGVLELNFAKRK